MREIEVVAEAAFADLPDGGVVVHTGTKRYYSLNPTGARIWTLLETTGDLNEAAAMIVTEYGLPLGEATRAVADLTDGLLAAGLIRRAGASGGV